MKIEIIEHEKSTEWEITSGFITVQLVHYHVHGFWQCSVPEYVRIHEVDSLIQALEEMMIIYKENK